MGFKYNRYSENEQPENEEVLNLKVQTNTEAKKLEL